MPFRSPLATTPASSLPRSSERGHRRGLRFESLETRRLLAIVINEIHYNPDVPTERVEFVELFNAGTEPVDLGGWRLDEGVDFEFPANTVLPAERHLVVAEDAEDFRDKFGFSPFGQWALGDRLSNEGERIDLRDAAGQLVDRVDYAQGFPWPVSGDYGSSIELIHPTLDNNVAGHWRSSGQRTTAAAAVTYISAGATWQYRKGVQQNPPADWRAPAFDAATDAVAWQSGATSIGFGDNDDATVLSDMNQKHYTFYARREFTIDGPLPDVLRLRLYVDDGAIVSINGTEVLRAHVTAGDKSFNSLSGVNHEADWEDYLLTDAADYLQPGQNVVAVHVLNSSTGSSDLSFNLELGVPASAPSRPTPGARNSVHADVAGPALSDLQQSVAQPSSGQEVTISVRAADPDGVGSVTLAYQTVEPGAYVRLTDAAYQTSWTTLPMSDDGLQGDAIAGDGVFTVTLPGELQTHRRLIRYRIAAVDATGLSVQAPYADDPQPNFAYFVYDGVPGWTGADRPGITPTVAFPTEITAALEPYHLIANSSDVNNSQYNGSQQDRLFPGTLVYDGHVYDHVEFQVRGEYSTFVSGKNKWLIRFHTGHEFAARDDYGRLYDEKWKRLNLNGNASPWAPHNRGMAGLDEAVSYRVFQLAGVPASHTNYVHFRVIDAAAEAPANQYDGDLWGLYLAVEHTGGRFLDERGLPDGNVYEIEGGQGDSRNQAADQPVNGADWNAIRASAQSGSAPESFWRENIDLDVYYSFDAVTRAVSNVDVRPGDNYVMYHHPDGKWQIIPWDLDMMYIAETHQTGSSYLSTYLSNARRVPQLDLEFTNRSRELLDLLFSDRSRSGGQIAQLVDEYARLVNRPDGAGGYLPGWAEIDRYMWNYHPRTTSSHRGAFYRTPFVDNQRIGGQWTRTLPSPDFAGMAQWVIDFMTDTDPNGFAVGDGDQRGYGYNYLELEAFDPQIPGTPSIEYVGGPDFPVDVVEFAAGPYSDPDGSPLAAIEWRVAEISNPSTPSFDPHAPWKYEIDSVAWESGPLSPAHDRIAVPAGALAPDRVYRARVRMQDATGRWSHWSEPIEFVAAAASAPPTLAIVELHYNPAPHPLDGGDPQNLEFVEILNYGPEPVELAGMQLTTFANVPYDLPAIALPAGERLVVARDPAILSSVYGDDFRLAPNGYSTANLSNGGETIELVAPGGLVVHAVTYDDEGAWPLEPDGQGPSLELISTQADPNDPASWRVSAAYGGSPGWEGLPASPGDFNADAGVDGRDFLLWQRSFGLPSPSLFEAEGTNDLVVDQADLALWASRFGETDPAAEPAAAVVADATLEMFASSSAAVSPAAVQQLTPLGHPAWGAQAAGLPREPSPLRPRSTPPARGAWAASFAVIVPQTQTSSFAAGTPAAHWARPGSLEYWAPSTADHPRTEQALVRQARELEALDQAFADA